MARPQRNIEERLVDVAMEPNCGCWIWLGVTNDSGYGIAKEDGVKRLAHRLSYRHFKGPLGDSKVLHKCDVKECINPDHLYLGTQADNMNDMKTRGRHKGTTGLKLKSRAKLPEEQLAAIKADTRPQRAIAQAYGLSQAYVSYIKKRLAA